MILALYFEKIFPAKNEDKGIFKSYSTEALRASFGSFATIEISSDHILLKSSLSATLVLPSAAIISLIPLAGSKTVKGVANENGDFLINESNPGDYEIIIFLTPNSGLGQKKLTY